jgi:hypothetical protein
MPVGDIIAKNGGGTEKASFDGPGIFSSVQVFFPANCKMSLDC